MYIGYFLLLLFCISTNMTQSMDDFVDFTQNEPNLQIQEGTYDLWNWNSTSSCNETRNSSMFSPQETTLLQGLDLLQAQEITEDLWKYSTFSKKYSNSSDIFTGEVFTTNRSSNSEQQADASNLSISSPGREHCSLPSENTNDFMDLTQQIPDSDTEEFFNSENTVASLQQISSHSKQQKNANYHSQQLFTESFKRVSQQFFSKQRPRKKRKINKEYVPDNVYFTIDCCYCSSKQQFKAQFKRDLTRNFKRHLNSKHPDITKEETKTYIDQHLQKPEHLVKFLISCLEPRCQEILHSHRKFYLKRYLFRHISDQHPKNKNDYSRESVATYVDNNCAKEWVSSDKQLKNLKKRKVSKKDIFGNTYFTIICIHCFFTKQFKSSFKRNLIDSFTEHLNNQHPNITKEETKIYIDQYLQKPELLVKLSIHCPESECQATFHGFRKLDLKISLFYHVLKNKKHQNKKQDYSKESLAMHVDNNCKQIFVSAQEQLKNTEKRKTNK